MNPPRSFTDRLSPVLVKEVRQALRGRMFTTAFVGALLLACFLAGVSFLEGGGGGGGRVVMPIYAVLAAALLVYVPFHAQQSMRQEDAEAARDLLALCPLGPWRIVVGKLLGALVVAALLVSAFLPFVVVIALHPGVDTLGVLALILHVLGVSVALSAIGVATGIARGGRAGMGAGSVLLAFLAIGAFALEVQLAERGLLVGSGMPRGRSVAVAWLVFAPLAPLLLGFGAAALARDDVDVSRGLRIAWVVAAAAVAVLLAAVLPATGAPAQVILVLAGSAILAGSLVAGVLCTEPPGLDRESRERLATARGPLTRVAGSLFAVGGGRGVLLTLAIGVGLGAAALIGCLRTSSGLSASAVFGSVVHLAVAVGMSLVFGVLPGRTFLDARSRPRARRAVRLVTVGALFGLSIFLPLFLLIATNGLLGGNEFWFSPFAVLVDSAQGVDLGAPLRAPLFLWALIGVLALFIALPSAVRGLREAIAARPGRGPTH